MILSNLDLLKNVREIVDVELQHVNLDDS
jgi:hypothetical protein